MAEAAGSGSEDLIEKDICVVCLNEVSEKATTSCNHTAFDFVCLVSWLERSPTCPLCKAQVTTVTYSHHSSSDLKTYHVPRQTTTTSLPEHPRPRRHISPQRTLIAQHFFYHDRQRRPRCYNPRGAANPIPYSTPNPDLALLRRRHIYRNQLYSLHVGANRISQYRNLTPSSIATSPVLQSRARMWIRRELRVFSFLHTDSSDATPASGAATTSSNAEWLLMYIVSIIKAVEIKGSSGQAEDMLQDFLGRENARLFLHELNGWLRSPYERLEDWDRAVQYMEILPDEFDEEGRAVVSRAGKRDPRGRNERRSRSPRDRRREFREREAMRRYDPD